MLLTYLFHIVINLCFYTLFKKSIGWILIAVNLHTVYMNIVCIKIIYKNRLVFVTITKTSSYTIISNSKNNCAQKANYKKY